MAKNNKGNSFKRQQELKKETQLKAESSKKYNLLIVDDVPDTIEIITRSVKSVFHDIYSASNVMDAIELLKQYKIDIVITDLKMPKLSGLELIKHITQNYKNIRTVMVTGYPSVDSAVSAMKRGAVEYLVKPFTQAELIHVISKIIQELDFFYTNEGNEKKGDDLFLNYNIVGNSTHLNDIKSKIEKIKNNDETVLITGESGTGKELIARVLHYEGKNKEGPFVAVNCAAIPEGLFESELFGNVKGAFTGANTSKAGLFQTAQNGTIFLDEIGEMEISLQSKLLRVIENKEIYMVGASKPIRVNLRIIAATNQDLEKLAAMKQFREDLFFRLNVIKFNIKPLRERKDDILLLTHHYLQKFQTEFHKPQLNLSPELISFLQNYSWPGNVRELQNLMKTLVLFAESSELSMIDLPDNLKEKIETGGEDFLKPLDQIECEYILKILGKMKNNKTKAAETLGITRKTLREKLKKYKIEFSNSSSEDDE